VNDRGEAQFAPFASLRGYYEQIEKKEELQEARRELSEDAQALLSRALSRLEKGQLVQICYYNGRRYVTANGILHRICFEQGTAKIGELEIKTEDIIRVKALT